jgi:hypothetical protein
MDQSTCLNGPKGITDSDAHAYSRISIRESNSLTSGMWVRRERMTIPAGAFRDRPPQGRHQDVGHQPGRLRLPSGGRPASTVYVPVDMCSATNGRLVITPSGVASVQAGGSNRAKAQCFTSLDGASFAP